MPGRGDPAEDDEEQDDEQRDLLPGERAEIVELCPSKGLRVARLLELRGDEVIQYPRDEGEETSPARRWRAPIFIQVSSTPAMSRANFAMSGLPTMLVRKSTEAR